MAHRLRIVAIALGIVAATGCGKKGPPLPPLRPVPGPVTEVTARRVNGRVEIRFTIPTTNTDRTSPAAVARIEVYARSVPADSLRPVKEQIVLRDNLVGTIDVKPPETDSDKNNDAKPGAQPPPPDHRPGTGEAAAFTETVPTPPPTPLPPLKGKAAQAAEAAAAAAKAAAGSAQPNPANAAAPGAPTNPPPLPTSTNPVTTTGTAGAVATGGAAPPVAGATGATAASTTGGQAAKASPPKPLPPTRYFWIQAISPHGQIGAPPDLIAVPLVDPPAAPHDPEFTYDEKTLTLAWQPGAEGEAFRVYDVDSSGKEKTGRPLGEAPLKTPQFQAPVVFDVERCLAIRAVETTGVAAVESDAVSTCTTPKDTFPPPAPANLNGLPDAGTISLRWDPVTASDLAGYLVLRGEGTGDTLQQLTPAPLTATTFVDATVRPGATYVYVVVAVDKSTPPNVSLHSNSYSVTIR
jgi:hypothetical protein